MTNGKGRTSELLLELQNVAKTALDYCKEIEFNKLLLAKLSWYQIGEKFFVLRKITKLEFDLQNYLVESDYIKYPACPMKYDKRGRAELFPLDEIKLHFNDLKDQLSKRQSKKRIRKAS